MTADAAVSAIDLEALRRLDTCTVSDAIETFEVRLRNTGFTDARIHCMFEDFPPMIGYAATARMRSVDPPIAGRVYHERGDWWQSILKVPAPRIVVLEDVDEPPGRGAFLGDMHTAILRALGCVGYVTNGAVRELPGIREFGFHLFAGSVTASHAYSHIFDFGHSVQVGGLEISPGSLLHADRHGVLKIPAEIAAEIPNVATKLRKSQQAVIDFCRSKKFTVEELSQLMNKQFR